MMNNYPADFMGAVDERPAYLNQTVNQQQNQMSSAGQVSQYPVDNNTKHSIANLPQFGSSSPPKSANSTANDSWKLLSSSENSTAKLNSQLGGFRTRARAGTLPSRFNSTSSSSSAYHPGSSLNFDFLSNHSANSLVVPSNNTANSSTSNLGINSRTSPLLTAVNSSSSSPAGAPFPARDPFSEILGFSGSGTANSNSNISASSSSNLPPVGGGRRLRSGSLFGFDSNIWTTGNNDLSSVMSNEPMTESHPVSLKHYNSMQQLTQPSQQQLQQQDQTSPQSPQIQPQSQHKQPTPPTLQHLSQSTSQVTQIGTTTLPDFSRIRSYTTTNALSEKQYHLPYDSHLNTTPNVQNVPTIIGENLQTGDNSALNTVNQLSPESTVIPQNSYDYVRNSDVAQLFDSSANQNYVKQTLIAESMLDISRPRSQTYSIGSNAPLNVETSGLYYNSPVGSQSILQQPQQNYNANLLSLTSPLSPGSNQHQPLLVDDVNLQMLEFCSTFQVATLSPTNAIVIMNLPPLNYGVTTASAIYRLVSSFGKTHGVYVFSALKSDTFDEGSLEDPKTIGTIREDDEYSHGTHDNVNRTSSTLKQNSDSMCAVVEFDNIEIAMRAKAQLNHQELFPNYTCIVGFAKILSNQYANPQGSNAMAASQGSTLSKQTMKTQPSSSSATTSVTPGNVDHERKNLLLTSEPLPFKEILPNLYSILEQFQVYVHDKEHEHSAIAHMIGNAVTYTGFDSEYGPLPDPISNREFDAPKLREIRKLSDSNQLSQFEIESIALAMYDEIAELSSDYLGNTVVQKIFEVSSEEVKDIVLKKIAPYIAQMGIHKNGTWAGQKIINVARTGRQKQLVKQSLLPYVAPLFKDGFGNYLVQGCLKFGTPWNNFIFEAICSKFWVLAQDRYGSRAIRAVLESGNCTIEQTSLLASLIIVYAEFLAIHSNGALLLTWYLDTCSLKNRHMILTKKILPWLVELSYNKLGSLTILKILNNRNHTEAGGLILRNLYGDIFEQDDDNDAQQNIKKAPDCLKQILKEFTYGPTFIHKTLSTPLVTENNLKPLIIQQIKKTLIDMNVTTYQQGYKRLMDEVGLSAKESLSVGRSTGTINGNTNGSNFNSPHFAGVKLKTNRNNAPGRGNTSQGSNQAMMAMVNGIASQNMPINSQLQRSLSSGSNNGNNSRYVNPLQHIVSPQFASQSLEYNNFQPSPQQQQPQFNPQYNQSLFNGYNASTMQNIQPAPMMSQQQPQGVAQNGYSQYDNVLLNQLGRLNINNNIDSNMNGSFLQAQPYNTGMYR